jgi:hypothetical protein
MAPLRISLLPVWRIFWPAASVVNPFFASSITRMGNRTPLLVIWPDHLGEEDGTV